MAEIGGLFYIQRAVFHIALQYFSGDSVDDGRFSRDFDAIDVFCVRGGEAFFAYVLEDGFGRSVQRVSMSTAAAGDMKECFSLFKKNSFHRHHGDR